MTIDDVPARFDRAVISELPAPRDRHAAVRYTPTEPEWVSEWRRYWRSIRRHRWLVLGVTLGPSYETRAEIAMLERMGADAVCMSTGPEVAAANEIGLPVACISCVTNSPATWAGTKHKPRP